MEFRLQNMQTNEDESKILGKYTFEKVETSWGDKTFCLLDWLTEDGCFLDCKDHTCRQDGNCDSHDRGSPCKFYDSSRGPSCRCDNHDDHGY